MYVKICAGNLFIFSELKIGMERRVFDTQTDKQEAEAFRQR